MEYKMKVVVMNPNTVNDDVVFNLYCDFVCIEKDYGNKHYLYIGSDESSSTYFSPIMYDLRYNKEFDKNNKEEWLKAWANTYWSGEKGSYKVKEIDIKKEK